MLVNFGNGKLFKEIFTSQLLVTPALCPSWDWKCVGAKSPTILLWTFFFFFVTHSSPSGQSWNEPKTNMSVGVGGGSIPGILSGGTSSAVSWSSEVGAALLSPVERFGEEAGGGAQPAPAGVVLGCGAGDGSVHLPLGAVLLLWEVVWDSRVLLHLHSSRVQWDKNLKRPRLDAWRLAFTPKIYVSIYFLTKVLNGSSLPPRPPHSSPPVGPTTL